MKQVANGKLQHGMFSYFNEFDKICSEKSSAQTVE
jgi:hypothetical protein